MEACVISIGGQRQIMDIYRNKVPIFRSDPSTYNLGLKGTVIQKVKDTKSRKKGEIIGRVSYKKQYY